MGAEMALGWIRAQLYTGSSKDVKSFPFAFTGFWPWEWHKLCQGRFRLDMRERFLTLRGFEH